MSSRLYLTLKMIHIKKEKKNLLKNEQQIISTNHVNYL